MRVLGPVSECYHDLNVQIPVFQQSLLVKNLVYLVKIESFDGAGINSDRSRSGHHIAKGDIRLLAGPIEQGTLIVQQM